MPIAGESTRESTTRGYTLSVDLSLAGLRQVDMTTASSKRVFITNVKGTFFGMSESEEASKRR